MKLTRREFSLMVATTALYRVPGASAQKVEHTEEPMFKPATAYAKGAQSPTSQGPVDPMARLKPVVGHWNVRHTLWTQSAKAPEVFEGTAEIYFIANGTVLVVDESTPDRRYRFVGYHSYDPDLGKYINWTAASAMVLAWGEGEFEGNREVFQTHRLDPKTGQPESLIGRGIWEFVGPHKHVFRAVRLQADGTEIPAKEEIYTRRAK